MRNAHEYLRTAEVGGALVGGASLKAADFNAIIRLLPIDTAGAPQSAVA
jgi:triosephosphate isomerase